MFALCRLQHHRSTSRGKPRNFGRYRGGVCKSGFRHTKAINIYEMRLDQTKEEFLYAFLIGAKINDLG